MYIPSTKIVPVGGGMFSSENSSRDGSTAMRPLSFSSSKPEPRERRLRGSPHGSRVAHAVAVSALSWTGVKSNSNSPYRPNGLALQGFGPRCFQRSREGAVSPLRVNRAAATDRHWGQKELFVVAEATRQFAAGVEQARRDFGGDSLRADPIGRPGDRDRSDH